MPWCPKCRNEYVEGKTHCPDCDVDLVEELSFEKEEILPPEDYEFPEDFRPEEVLNGPKERPKPVRTYKSPEEPDFFQKFLSGSRPSANKSRPSSRQFRRQQSLLFS